MDPVLTRLSSRRRNGGVGPRGARDANPGWRIVAHSHLATLAIMLASAALDLGPSGAAQAQATRPAASAPAALLPIAVPPEPGPSLADHALPPAQAPVPARHAALTPVRTSSPLPPPAAPESAARLLPFERQYALPRRPALEAPEIAALSEPLPWQPLRFRAAPAARADGPDPNRLSLPLTKAPANIDRATPADDPAPEESARAALVGVRAFQKAPAPFLRLVLPDPFELLNAVKLLRPPLDDDPPAIFPAQPPRPKLPAK